MKKIVIFGLGMMFDVVAAHMIRDEAYDIVAVTVDKECLPTSETISLPITGKVVPVIPFDALRDFFPPDDYGMFVAIGYHEMNKIRSRKCAEAKEAGYELVSYVSKRANIGEWVQSGVNCMILDDVSIQPKVIIGSNVWLWNGVLVGHHSQVSDDCWVAGGVTIGGGVQIDKGCFFGLGSVIGGAISIGESCFIGARSLVTKSAAPKQVFIEPDTKLYRLDSENFARISRLVTIGVGNER